MEILAIDLGVERVLLETGITSAEKYTVATLHFHVEILLT